VLCPRVTHCATKKESIFLVLFLFLFFNFVFIFFNFLKSLEKNKRMLRYKEGTSVTSILVPSARNILMLKERRHVQEKDTQ
jgi:hypothetical protein